MTAVRPPLQLMALLLCLVALPLAAQELYLWTDEAGVRHISDRRPDGDYAIDVQKAIARPEQPVAMENVGTERAPEWRFTNRLHGPVSVAVAFSEAANVVSDPELPTILVIPGLDHRSLLIAPLDNRAAWRYAISTRAVPGPTGARPDSDFRYALPFSAGTELQIGQGFGGRHSHFTPESRFAVDFSLPEGTPVLAARGGVVMDLQRWFHRTGEDLERDGPRANYVRVLHEDGTMAVYAHLAYNGVSVRPGQRVEAGQELGRSGNTGYSTGPHLHFAVQVNRGMELVSIPFRMQGRDGGELALDAAGSGSRR